MNISALRRAFNAAIRNRDAETILEILDKLYYAEEFDLFDKWKAQVSSLLKEMMEEDRDIIQTEALSYV